MKVFEVRIRKTRTATACGFTWPSWWDEVKDRVQVLSYEDHPEQAGDCEEGAICVTDDETWTLIESKGSARAALLSVEEANAKGRVWSPQVTKVQDPTSAIMALGRVAMGGSLTENDRAILDPEDPTPGIGKTRLFDVSYFLNRDDG